jgi:hypothetical protein
VPIRNDRIPGLVFALVLALYGIKDEIPSFPSGIRKRLACLPQRSPL